MAKRRKLEAPSSDALEQIEAEFEVSAGARPALAPIAQVASEAAEGTDVLGVETRAKLAEAEAYRQADAKGLVMKEIPLDLILMDEFARDRAVIDRDELTELRVSIVKNGLRLPIEVYALADTSGGHEYALISGYRRLLATQEALNGTGLDRFKTIKAIIRPPADSAAHIAAMVEENEVRASLSHYERGRVAVLSAHNGVFANVEAAVDALFPFASKAKRSKIRSFALVFEELGDMFDFPEALTERQGLAIAAALREGAEHDLRLVLAQGASDTAKAEWDKISSVLDAFASGGRDPSRGGRPSSKPAPSKREMVDTPRGVRISWEPIKSGGYTLRLNGDIDKQEIDSIVASIKERLY